MPVEDWKEGSQNYFGDHHSSNLTIQVGSDTNVTDFHVHWEVLTSASIYFQKMRNSQLKESIENKVVFPLDSPTSWKNLLSRIYPPFPDFEFESAISVIPLVKFYDMKWLMPKLTLVFSESKASERTPKQADVLCNNGLALVVSKWFDDASWGVQAAPKFILECNSVGAVREAGAFVFETMASITKNVAPYMISDSPAARGLRKSKNFPFWLNNSFNSSSGK